MVPEADRTSHQTVCSENKLVSDLISSMLLVPRCFAQQLTTGEVGIRSMIAEGRIWENRFTLSECVRVRDTAETGISLLVLEEGIWDFFAVSVCCNEVPRKLESTSCCWKKGFEMNTLWVFTGMRYCKDWNPFHGFGRANLISILMLIKFILQETTTAVETEIPSVLVEEGAWDY